MNRRITIGLVLLAGAVVLGFPAAAGSLDWFDIPVFRLLALTAESPHWLVATAQFVSHLGDVDLRSVFVVAVCALFVARHCWRSAVIYLIIAIVSIMGHAWAKLAYARPRPHLTPWLDSAGDFSYPSGHAAGSMVVLFAAALLVRDRWVRWPLLGIAFAIGITRPMLGMHWPSDVVGGWMWGAGFALIGAGVAVRLGLPRVRVLATDAIDPA